VPIPDEVPQPKRKLARDQAYDRIKDAILRGVLRPGERLDDAELQRWLGVSRTPVRQALYALTLEGLVETAPQAYTRVVEPEARQAVQYLQTIGVLVIGIMELSLPQASDAELEQLAVHLGEVRDCLVAEDLEASVAASERYHLALVDLCTNAPLRHLSLQAGPFLAYYVTTVSHTLDVDWKQVADDYSRLIDAVRERRIADSVAVVKRLFAITQAGLVTSAADA
jgi:DNA-binding GntR family transcriptional regulator